MTNYDSSGNVSVDFVWGNFPLQPNDGRSDTVISIPQVEDYGWSQARKFVSDTLNPNLSFHSVATTGWSNFPAFIENYSGDDDPELEAVVPNLVRMNRSDADDLLSSLGLNIFQVGHTLGIHHVSSNGKVVRVSAFDDNAWGDSALMGLRAGDQVEVDLLIDSVSQNFGTQTITNFINDGEASWFEFKLAQAPEVAYDDVATGTVWAGPNIANKILLQRFWNQPGSIKNEGTNIHVRYLSQS